MLGFFTPFSGLIGSVVTTALLPLIAMVLLWLWKELSLWGITISAAHRAALTSALDKAAGNLVNLVMTGQVTQAQLVAVLNGSGIPMAMNGIIQDLKASVPDALAHFGLTANEVAIAKKIIGVAGGLMAPTPATLIPPATKA